MREFLLELYLQHGERWHGRNYGRFTRYAGACKDGYVVAKGASPEIYKITPKGLEYLKNA